MGKGNRNIPESVKDQYLEWLLTPPPERNPQTKQAMADELGVNVNTLWNWEKTPKFAEGLRSIKHQWGLRFHGEILSRLMSVVANGTDTAAIQAAKVLLPHLDTGPKEVTEGDLDEISLERIKEGLKEAGFEVAEPQK